MMGRHSTHLDHKDQGGKDGDLQKENDRLGEAAEDIADFRAYAAPRPRLPRAKMSWCPSSCKAAVAGKSPLRVWRKWGGLEIDVPPTTS